MWRSAYLHYRRGDFAGAEERTRLGLEIHRELLKPGARDFIFTLHPLGLTLAKTGRGAEAVPLLKECLGLVQQFAPDEAKLIAELEAALAGRCAHPSQTPADFGCDRKRRRAPSFHLPPPAFRVVVGALFNMSQTRRVVITGMGVISPVGNDLTTFWDNLTRGHSGIGPITHFDVTEYDCRIAGEVRDFDAVKFFKTPKDVRRTDRFTHLAVGAAKMAMENAGLTVPVADPERFGVMLGSGIGGLKTTEDQHTVLMNKGPSRISPFMIPMLIGNMASGIVSMEYGMQGPNFATVSACATSAHAIGEAWRMIRDGDAEAFLAGGSEAAIVPLGIGGFAAMRALSTRNDEPARASRPWDRDRDGFVMGEGAGVIVMEELEHAKRRGAHIAAEIVGYGLTADAFHMSAPLPNHEQAQRCMRMALAKAGLNIGDVDYLNAHGTSTPIGDVCEVRAIKAVFGDHARNGLLTSSTKSMTGHLLGAAGVVETIVCAKAIETGLIPPTINLENPGEECDLDFVPNTAREKKVRVALNNSFGFGGHNATLVIRAFD